MTDAERIADLTAEIDKLRSRLQAQGMHVRALQAENKVLRPKAEAWDWHINAHEMLHKAVPGLKPHELKEGE